MAVGISACGVGESAIRHGDQSIFIVRVGEGRILRVVIVLVSNLCEVFESSIGSINVVNCFLTEGKVSAVAPWTINFLENYPFALERERKQEK